MAEHDHRCRSALVEYFERTGYQATEATDGPSTLRAVFQHSASLVLLDLSLPGFDGADVLAKIRRHSAVPVIVCSGRDSEDERIRTLNLGADDFVLKPFSFAELEARVRAVLRRGNGEPAATCLHHGELVVDRDTRTVSVRDKAIAMTRKEFDLLAFLAASPGQVFSRAGSARAGLGLDRRVAGPLDGHRACPPRPPQDRIRSRKPDLDPTVRGIGYRFAVSPHRGRSAEKEPVADRADRHFKAGTCRQRAAPQAAQPASATRTTAVMILRVRMLITRSRL